MCPWDLPKKVRAAADLPSTFRAITGPSVNFPSILVTFCQLLLTLRASSGPSVNILCIREPSKNVSYSRWTFRQL